MTDLNHEVEKQIAAGKIIFDTGSATRLKSELLRQNTGTKITEKVQTLVIELSKLATPHLRISSLVRSDGGHHGLGRAVDVGNEEIAATLLPQVATDSQVAALRIDELIFDAAVAGQADRNHWNYDQGAKHAYGSATLDQHRNHIHFSVKL